jgi:hypothetical protein
MQRRPATTPKSGSEIDDGAGLLAMALVIGPVLTRTGGYAFDAWTPEEGLSRGYVYPRIEDAYYARKAEVRSFGQRDADRIVACNTVDEFVRLQRCKP